MHHLHHCCKLRRCCIAAHPNDPISCKAHESRATFFYSDPGLLTQILDVIEEQSISGLLLMGRLLTVCVAIVHAAHNAASEESDEPAVSMAKHALHLGDLRAGLNACCRRLRCRCRPCVSCLFLCNKLGVSMCWLRSFHAFLCVESYLHLTVLGTGCICMRHREHLHRPPCPCSSSALQSTRHGRSCGVRVQTLDCHLCTALVVSSKNC